MIIKPLSHWSLHKLLHRVFRLILLSNFYMVHSQMSKEEGLGFERQICGDGSNCSWPQRHSHWPSNEDFDLDFEGQSKQPKCSKIWSNFLSNYSFGVIFLLNVETRTAWAIHSLILWDVLFPSFSTSDCLSLSPHNKCIVSIKDKLSLSLSLSLSLLLGTHYPLKHKLALYKTFYLTLYLSNKQSFSTV